MKLRCTIATLLAVAALQSVAIAQFPFDDDPPAPPWEQFTLDPKVKVKLDFRNASVDAILQALSEASGVTIVKDPALNGGLTLQSPKQQSLADAFAQLNAVLGLKNYEIQREGNFLIIRAKQQRFGGFGGRFGGSDGTNGVGGEGFGGRSGRGGDSSESVLRVYQIKYANASQVARVLNEVFAGSGVPPVQQQPQPQRTGQASSPSPVQVAQRGGRGGFGGFGGNGQRFGGRTGTVSATSVVRASADDFSNSVIVNAPSREQEQVARLIEQIDKQTEQPQQSRVFNLQFASATDLAPVVQNVLLSNVPRGRGGFSAPSSTPFDQRFGGGGAARFGAAASAIGTVVPELRTNALVVTTTEDNLSIVEKVIEELDKEVTFENSSFVVTLENARADQMATLLNQSFGGRVGGGQGQFLGGNRTATMGGNRTQNQNRNQAPRSTTGGNRGGGRGPNAQDVELELAEPEAEEGELATNVRVAQGGFGQFGGGNRGGRAQQPGATTGFDNQGRVVNVRDLSGQVVAIPDVNTNSVIIVTSPENREILEQILTQLDRIPEQVMIETLIVEASLDATNKLGVEWQFGTKNVFGDKNNQGSGTANFGLQANTTQPQGLRYTLTGSQYSVFLTALQGDSRFEVLSTPRIFTSNNATAEINISQSLPYVLSQRADVNGNLLFNYAFLDVGIILTVTPRITSNGYVTMEVTQTANDFVGYTDFNAPIVNQREAQTTVSVKDGETIVLGGIIKNTVTSRVNKLPILGDIPILGNLFKSTSQEKNKTELLVFLTPRIVRDATEAAKVRENTEKLMDGKTRGKLEDYRKLLERNGITTAAPAALPPPPPAGTAAPPPPPIPPATAPPAGKP